MIEAHDSLATLQTIPVVKDNAMLTQTVQQINSILDETLRKRYALEQALHYGTDENTEQINAVLTDFQESVKRYHTSTDNLSSLIAAINEQARSQLSSSTLTGTERRVFTFPTTETSDGLAGNLTLSLKQSIYILLSCRKWSENWRRFGAAHTEINVQHETNGATMQSQSLLDSLSKEEARWAIAFLRQEADDLRQKPESAAKHPYFGSNTFPTANGEVSAMPFLAETAESEVKYLETKFVLAHLTPAQEEQQRQQITVLKQCLDNVQNVPTPLATATATLNSTVIRKPGSSEALHTSHVSTVNTENSNISELPVPKDGRPNVFLTQRDLGELLHHLQKYLDAPKTDALKITKPTALVSRLQLMTALVKLTFNHDEIVANQSLSEDDLPQDVMETPTWGRPYVIVAVAQGWWSAKNVLAPRDPANWAFVKSVLKKMPLHPSNTEAPLVSGGTTEPIGAIAPEQGAFTGLIIDTRAFQFDLVGSIRLLDQAGNVLFPDNRNLPGEAFLLNNGLVGNAMAVTAALRTGFNPLTVRALKVKGADIVVSDEDAKRIQTTDKHGHFMARWAVSILLGGP